MRRPAWLFAIFVGALSAPGVCLAETIPFPTVAEQTTSAPSTSTAIDGMGCDPTRPETCVTESTPTETTVISLPTLDVALEPSLTLALDVVYGRHARSVYGSVYTIAGNTAAPTSTTTTSQSLDTTTAIAPLEIYSDGYAYGRVRNGRAGTERAPAPPQSRRPSNRIPPPPPPPPPPTPVPEPIPITPPPEPIIVPPDPAPSGTQTPTEPLPPSTFDGTGLPEGSDASPVPEPGTAVLTGIGLALIAAVLRLRKFAAR